MPIKRCQKSGKSGWKFGDSGKCFTGPGGRNKALRQGRAIKSNSSRLNQLLVEIAEVIESSIKK